MSVSVKKCACKDRGIIPWTRFFLEKLVVVHYVTKFYVSMEAKIYFVLQEPASFSYLESVDWRPRPPTVNSLTNVVTQCSRSLLDKLTSSRLVKKFPAFYGTRRFITAFNPYPTAFPYGNGMVLHFYQQQESSTTKTVHKVINKRLKTYV